MNENNDYKIALLEKNNKIKSINKNNNYNNSNNNNFFENNSKQKEEKFDNFSNLQDLAIGI
jgi:hypothetical protein